MYGISQIPSLVDLEKTLQKNPNDQSALQEIVSAYSMSSDRVNRSPHKLLGYLESALARNPCDPVALKEITNMYWAGLVTACNNLFISDTFCQYD